MTDTDGWSILFEKVARDPNQVFIVANVFGRPTTRKQNASILFRINISKSDIGLQRVTLLFFGGLSSPASPHAAQADIIAAQEPRRWAENQLLSISNTDTLYPVFPWHHR